MNKLSQQAQAGLKSIMERDKARLEATRRKCTPEAIARLTRSDIGNPGRPLSSQYATYAEYFCG